MWGLTLEPALDRTDLLAEPVAEALRAWKGEASFRVARIDPGLAACVVLATTRADVNGVVRRRLDARKASFAPQDQAVAETGMEYGGITPFGLPPSWPVLVDEAVTARPYVVVGSGVRRSKLIVPGTALAGIATAEVLPDLAR
jgi:prolyl-tRNA editing enzyme YbaK/EbsC (Cys-tRNA(Pro) deacylase)